MYDITISKQIPWQVPQTPKAQQVMHLFGLRPQQLGQRRLIHSCRLSLRPGDIVYITGASGAGKTVLLNAIYEQIPDGQRIRLDDIPIETGRPLIDCIERPPLEALEVLSRAGLSDVFCALQQPDQLSEGQKIRYRLARALMSSPTVLFADEFTSSLDRITASVLAARLRAAAAKSQRIFVLASCHEDILPDLLPDILIVKYLTGRTETLCRDKRRSAWAE